MHDYALTQRLVETLLERLAAEGIRSAGRVREVSLTVGALDMHSESSFKQNFEALVRGTLLEGSRLRLAVAPAALSCGKCGRNGPLPAPGDGHGHSGPYAECPDCGGLASIAGGRGVQTIELRLEDD